MEQRLTIPGNKVLPGDIALIGHQKFHCHRVLRHGPVINLIAANGDVARIAPHLLTTVIREATASKPVPPRVPSFTPRPPLTPVKPVVVDFPKTPEPKASSVSMALLRSYRDAKNGLTDVEALRAAGFDLYQDGYRRRCSDLRAKGWIEKVREYGNVVQRYDTETRGFRMVCQITEAGQKRAAQEFEKSA